MLPTEVKPQKYRSIDQIMKDDRLRAKLSNYVDEAVKCKSLIATQQENIKALREEALKELGIKPKLFNAYVSATFNNDYNDRRLDLEEQLDLVEKVMQVQGLAFDDDAS